MSGDLEVIIENQEQLIELQEQLIETLNNNSNALWVITIALVSLFIFMYIRDWWY